MHHWTTSRKLWATLALMWVGMLFLVGWTAYDKRAGLLEERVTSLRHFIDSGRTLAREYVELVGNGEMTVEEAQAAALRRLQNMSFGKDGYVFVFDSNLDIVSHPAFAVGSNMRSYQDAKGRYTFKELKEAAQPPEGDFITYEYRPNADADWQTKMSYVQKLPAWDWHIGTGAYLTDVNTAFKHSLIELGLLLLLIGAIVTAVMAWIIRDVLNSLGGDPRQAQAIVKQIAAGDLTQSLKLKDGDTTSLLASIEAMRQRLSTSLSQVRQAAESINVGVGQIAAGNQDLSARTEQQAASIEETASSMEELTQTVRQNTDNAHQASTIAEETSTTAHEGGEMMGEVVTTMESIAEGSRRVNEIIEVIDSIAFQTNILALNASVEAARAGEQGRGFAVVAGEVRLLASRSADAAREIRAMIQASNEQINAGATLVGQTGDTIQNVVTSVARMSDLMQDIAAASNEQRAGIEQVTQAIGQMDQVTQQNASLVQEASASSSLMKEQASQLDQIVSWFKLNSSTLPKANDTKARPAIAKSLHRVDAKPLTRQEPAKVDEWEDF